MNNRIFASTLAAAFFASCAAAGLAQGGFGPGQGGFQRGRRGGFRGQGGFAGPGGQFGQFGPGARGGFGMQFAQTNDRNPLTSHVYALVNRPDVQNNIRLDLNQKNALAQYQQQAQDSIRQQMQQMFQNMRAQRGQRGQRGQGAQRDPNQRQQMREQMQSQRAEIQNKITTGLNDVLKPDQVKRLHELDLQWRGVLSLADPKVADEVQVSSEHRAAISTLLNDYQAKQREARQQMFQQFRANRQQPNQPNQPNQQRQLNAQTGANPFLALQRQDDAARKDAEEKALALLSADERAKWQKAQGAPFTFRTDIQTPR